MAKNNPLPILITFDGEARSGKGTIVQATKDYIRDTLGHKVMLIDAGQVFRVLVVAATRAGVALTDANAVDAFLADETNIHGCMQLVKDVYHMQKSERDALLYTNAVGVGSAQVAAHPLSQDFKDLLLRGWLKDARSEGFEVVLLDGRALEETGLALQQEGLCDFRLGLYFICDGVVGARRTLGFADCSYDELTSEEKTAVDELIKQIDVRNVADENRPVQPLVRPRDTPTSHLPHIEQASHSTPPIYLLDTSAEMKKDEMSRPVMEVVSSYLDTAK